MLHFTLNNELVLSSFNEIRYSAVESWRLILTQSPSVRLSPSNLDLYQSPTVQTGSGILFLLFYVGAIVSYESGSSGRSSSIVIAGMVVVGVRCNDGVF